MNGFLQDNYGNLSSKRLWGSIMLGAGVLMGTILFLCSVFIEVRDSQTALYMVNTFLISGSTLLGFGIFEKILNRKK
jgi:uncharacterized membrane protein